MFHRTILAFALLLFMLPLVSGCNTTEGFGQDVEALGDNIEDEAAENKTY